MCSRGRIPPPQQKISMNTSDYTPILLSFLAKYKSGHFTYDPNELEKLFESEVVAASKQFDLLNSPRTCSKHTYVSHWLREVLDSDYISRDLQKVDLHANSNETYATAVSRYFSLLPLEKIEEVNKTVFEGDMLNQSNVWNSFNLPVDELNTAFISLAKARNMLANDQSYATIIDLHIEKNKIPQDSFDSFVSNVDSVIQEMRGKIPMNNNSISSKVVFSPPCSVCSLVNFPFDSLNQVTKYVIEKYPLLIPFEEKLTVELGESTYMRYKKETDNFIVTINKRQNIRHQTLDLIHEIGHVINYLDMFAKDLDPLSEGVYVSELGGIRNQHEILKSISSDLFHAYVNEILILFWKVLFQIELYLKPDQDIGELYLQTYHRVFQTEVMLHRDLYLIDEYLLMKPLRSLPHAVAHFTVLGEREI